MAQIDGSAREGSGCSDDDCPGRCSEPHADLDLPALAQVIQREAITATVRKNQIQLYDSSGWPICRPLSSWLIHVLFDFDGDENLAALDVLATA
ncbi:MAG: hypothetical protein QOD92_1052 [Acidimicrobiaceae bacterium]